MLVWPSHAGIMPVTEKKTTDYYRPSSQILLISILRSEIWLCPKLRF